MESPAAWLERRLMRISCQEAEQLDSDTVASLVAYCELATPEDAAEYLTNIVNHESCNEVVKEYLQRRTKPPSTIKSESGMSMQAYQKSQTEDSKPGRHMRNKAKQKAISQETAVTPASTVPVPAPAPAPTSAPQKQTSNNKGRRGTKAISMAEARKLVDFHQGKPCYCQATRHGLINNCLACGKIVCQQEGEGPCNFCGALVLREGSNYAGLDGTTMPTSESEVAALAFKDRLVDYDRNSASRTTVIDDQSDFFDAESDVWTSEEDKELLRKKQEEMERLEEERKKRVVVTFDLLGRKVVMAGGAGSENAVNESIFRAEPGNNQKPIRVHASPSVREPPVYVHTGQSKSRSNKNRAGSMAVTGRVQYDDNVVAAELSNLQIGDSREWSRPRASSAFEDACESFECGSSS